MTYPDDVMKAAHHVCGLVVLFGAMVWLVAEIVVGLIRVVGS